MLYRVFSGHRSDSGQTHFGLLWTMLETYLKPVLSKHRGVALGVWGEAGIGKSYTVASVLKKLPCHTLSLHATTPLASLVSQLSKPKKLALWAEKTLEKVQKGEQVETSNLISALGASLAGLAPFVLHLEDMHEANPERLAFLHDLAQTVQKLKGVGLLVTSRQMPSEPFMSVKLESLSKEDSDKLLESELKAILPKEGLEFIYSKASGNPLFTLEYMRFLARAGHLWNDGKSWHWRKPEKDTLPAVVEVLLEQMIMQAKTVPIHRYVLETKALLPLDASDDLWAKVARVTTQELHTALGELSTQGVFKENGFAHPLVREVTLKTLSSDRRQHLARRAINVLKDEPEQAALFIDDAKLENEKSLELLKYAAEKAKEHNKLQLASFLAKAVDYATGEEKGKLALEAAWLLDGIDYPKILELLEDAIYHLAEPNEALYLKASVFALQGKHLETQAILEAIPTSGKQGRVWLEQHIKLLHRTTQYEGVVQMWESQAELQAQVESFTVHIVAWAYIHLGNLGAAAALTERWLAKPELAPYDKWSLLEALASIAFYQGNYQEAETYFSEALALPLPETLKQDMASLLRNRSVNRLQLGRYAESLPDLHAALTIYSEAGNSIYYAQTLIMISYAYQELGDYKRTEDVLLEALDIFRRVAPQPYLSHALAQLSSLYIDMSAQVYLAKKYALEAMQVASEIEAMQVGSKVTDKSYLVLGTYATSCAELATGNPNEALKFAEKSLELAKQIDNFEAVVKCHAARGLALQALGRNLEAQEDLNHAFNAATQQGMILEATRFALELDRLNNDLEGARTHMKWFEERGLMNGVNIAKRYFPELATEDAPPVILTSEDMPHLEVLGLMRVSQHKKVEAVKGRKRQELLAVLLDARIAGHTEVGRLELFDKLYSSEDELKAANNLKDLVHILRENLGATAITTTATGYALGAIGSDAEEFLKTGDTNLWRGVYLEGLTVEGQDTVSESLYLMLFEKAKGLLESDPKETARLGRVLLAYDPYNRDYLTVCLQAFRESNNHKSLTRSYTEAKGRFVEVGETLPVNWQAFLG
jgi:tetratricopeptide (TPR) repeat protein